MKWTDEEIQVLEDNRYEPPEAIASNFLSGRSINAVKDKRVRLGLPQLILCKDCGSSFVKNSQHEVCSTCAKDYHHHNHSVLGKYNSYKHGAKRRGFEWDITPEQFHNFWHVPCHYCGDEIQGVGIDRVDNSQGYLIDNCVPCCETCNEMKLDYGLEYWLDHMKKILRHVEATQ